MQEKNEPLNIPVRYFKGVGPKKAELLARLGMQNVLDILFYLPARYEDRSKLTPIKELIPGESHTIQGEIVTVNGRIAKSGISLFQAEIKDASGSVRAVWFNQPYLKDYFRKGVQVVLYGKAEMHDKLQLTQPEYEILKGDETDSVHMGRIVPIYALTSGIGQRYIRSLVFQAVAKYCRCLKEALPTYILAREKLVDIRFAVNNIHFPTVFENLEKAYRRIVFEEFFMLQLALAIKKKDVKTKETSPGHKVDGEIQKAFRDSLPFELTDAQNKAIADIERDMSGTRPMNRLLEGDVGSGKTIVASYALMLTVGNHFQGVLMAPTEVLARQHFIGLSELLMPLGINVVLLIGGIDQKSKESIYSRIKSGDVDIVVGTHAVIQEAVEFKRLGLAVIDEQHKFGVTQRSAMKQKGFSPHILVMTATPIPRTLALTVYGDLDISVIKQLPKGRKPIATYWIEEEKRANAYNFIKEEIRKGRQAYVVCPLIESQGEGRVGAEELFKKLKSEIFTDFKVGLLHGRMTSSEKDKAMKNFKNGKTDILVSTVVIEVGIDVPNATVMLIENADRFGLAQLHQLRGRIGRGVHESYCILLADPKTEDARKRLETIEDTLDGFQIAEADLNIRGPGEFFGTRQHGLPEIRFGNILKDFAIMERARTEAFDLIAKDPDLREEHHKLLKDALLTRFKDRLDLIGVG
ncbi:MAG: ATP-dependent DNA helicase RecG [Candidatus Omnitrophota bacterium]|jgi:ATP-dependent DNA helicase RecG